MAAPPASPAPAAGAIRAVILDAGGVMLFPDLDWLCAQAARQGIATTRAALHLAYYRTICQLDLDPGVMPRGAAFVDVESRRWFFSRMLRHAGAPAAQAQAAALPLAELAARVFPRESDIYHFAMPGLRDRLQAIRDAGLLLGAASNNDDALSAQLTSVGVIDLFGALKDSGVEGVSKPDPELLLRAARDLGVAPSRCLYVGDVDRVDGQAARAAGMRFALLDPLLQPRPAAPETLTGLEQIPARYGAPGPG